MALVTDWSLYPNFEASEFNCKATGKNKMQAGFMARLQALRVAFGKPMRISSGYRDPSHPSEAAKGAPGTHSDGVACDVIVRGSDAFELVRLAISLGFTGIGVAQKGSVRFVHLDDAEPGGAHARPMLWSY